MASLMTALAADAVAIGILVCAVYFRRHHRRDLALAYIALNTGILAVTTLLSGVADRASSRRRHRLEPSPL